MGDKKKIVIPKSLMGTSLRAQEETLEVPTKDNKLFIGLPKETAFQENRIALTPSSVNTLVNQGHRVVVESGAGERSNYSDLNFSEAGAEIAFDTEQVYKGNIILKVAPPSLQELEYCQPSQVLISPIHLPTLSSEYIYRLKKKQVIALAMEYIKDKSNSFPFVHIMSEMAGISAIQTAAELLTTTSGGRGVLLGGIAGVPPAKVVILGGGVVAEFAARAALGFGSEVRIFDNNVHKLMRIQHNLGQRVYTSAFNQKSLSRELYSADVVIGAIHSPTGRAPIVISEQMVENMKFGAVVIDVSIDQGGCFATSRVTTHEKPTFIVHDVIHYCVPNIASRVSRTGSTAVSNILTPLLLKASESKGLEVLIRQSAGLQHGVYTYKGCLTNQHLSSRFNIKFTDLSLLLMSEI